MKESFKRMHVIFNSGIGAISSMKLFSGMLKHPSINKPDWIDSTKINDSRLESLLNVAYFKQPPSGEKSSLGFRLFPRMYSCPWCHDIKTIEEWYPNGLSNVRRLKCTNDIKDNQNRKCNRDLVPSRFIMICPNGHMDDFPYSKWVHGYKQCTGINPPGLKLFTNSQDSTLANIRIECVSCGKKRNMRQALIAALHVSEDGNDYYKCTGRKYEMHEKLNHQERCDQDCGILKGTPRIRFVLRTAANVYFPIIYTSLILPEYQFDDETIYLHQNDAFKLYLTEPDIQTKSILLKSIILMLKKKFPGHSDSKYSDFVQRAEATLPDPNAPRDLEMFKRQEFLSLCERHEDQNFICAVKRSNNNQFMIESISEVERLQQLAALAGYTRIFPRLPEEAFDNPKNSNVKVVYLSTTDSSQNRWLPAVELFGEGIFIKFSDNLMEQKILNNSVINDSMDKLLRNREDYITGMGGNTLLPNARFMALHSLSHQIIKEISFETGYSLASLKERIYCNLNSTNYPMNGILIYVVDTDVMGTLGGLSRLSEESTITKIIERALKHSEYCSNDPVCFESKGQSLYGLNLAACHSCLLLPETCCENKNRFLDRKIMLEVFGK